MLRMDEINKIRKAYLVDGESKYAIALRFRRSWETINNRLLLKLAIKKNFM